ncbi:hypothetical protein GH721_08570 [Kriegella sp. EG-1]|nr:hypothetical protein [Flavobacteriaceae bacterium EG-1]
MSLSKLFESATQSRSTFHFANIVKLAKADGNINLKDQLILDAFSKKLGVNEEKVYRIYEHLDTYPIPHITSKEVRMEYLHFVFQKIYAKSKVEEVEFKFLKNYAVGLGFSNTKAEKIIRNTINLYSGNFTLKEYSRIINCM